MGLSTALTVLFPFSFTITMFIQITGFVFLSRFHPSQLLVDAVLQ